MTRRTITAWLLVHKWTSLACTVFLLMLCVTGLPLIFHNEIDGWLDPSRPLAAVRASTVRPSLDAIVARAVAGGGEVPLYLSIDEDRPVVNVTTGPAPDAPAAAMRFWSFDARTGAPLPPRGTGSGVMAFVLRLHTDLLLGQWAEWLLGAMGLVFVAAIGSGVVLYAPFMARLGFGTIRGEKGERVRRLDRHNLLGIATAAWAVVVGLTGTINTLADPITEAWKADQLAAIARPGLVPTGRRAPLQPAVAAAMRAVPGMRVQFVAFPGVAYSSHRHYGIFLAGGTPLTGRLLTPVFVDATTGRIEPVRPMPWYMKALLLAQPLHFGDYAGLPMKLIWAALDLLTITVLMGGVRLWLDRGRGLASRRGESSGR